MPDVTPDALARIESTAATLGSLACVACPEHVSPAQEDTLECLLRTDVPALVAALREAWAERDGWATQKPTVHRYTRHGVMDAPEVEWWLDESDVADAWQALSAQRDVLRRHLLTAEAERDAAREQLRLANIDAANMLMEWGEAHAALARVEALCDDEAWKVSDFWLMGDAIRAAITGPTPTDRVDGSGNGAGAVTDGAP